MDLTQPSAVEITALMGMLTQEARRTNAVSVEVETSALKIKLLMGPAPVAPEKKPKDGEPPEITRKRAHYENLLGRPVADFELQNLP